jgi:beta-glucosidase
LLNGGWTITWQGDNEALYPKDKLTILEAIQNKAGANRVDYVEAVTFDKELDIPKAVSAAGSADIIIACVGEPTYCETPGNINDLTLSAPQIHLVQELAKTGKPIVMVLVEGRPRVVRTIVDDAGAILMTYLPGMEGGQAIADVLFGDANPSGKLPYTYPKYSGWYVCYDHKKSAETAPNKFDPQWQFGHGLSYTTFEYSNLQLDKKKLSPDDTLTVTVNVANTGSRHGAEIVQLYLSDIVASITPPVKSLKRFTKVSLKPGEKRTVRFELGRDDFEFIGRDNKPVVEPGDFKVGIGGLNETFTIL